MPTLVLNRQECSHSHCVEQRLTLNGAELEIYDFIVPWKYDESDPSVTTQDITNVLKEVGDSEDLSVRINCRGGEVGTALAIYNRLRDHKGNVTTIVDGYAFSCAGWIAQAGDTRNIARGGIFMIHNPQMTPEIKSLQDIENVKNQWVAHQNSILDIFENRTSIPVEDVKNLMERETFLSSSDAIDQGFFDGLHEVDANLSALNYVAPASLPSNLFTRTVDTKKVTPVDVQNLKAQRAQLMQQESDLLAAIGK